MSPLDGHENNSVLIAQAIIKNLDENLVSIRLLDEGSTSRVFLLDSGNSKYVLKIAKPHPGKSASYESDFAIRKALNETNLTVCAPLATHQSMPIPIDGIWALDRYCEGTHPDRGMIPAIVSRQLGVLLRGLHKLPVTHFGQLKNSHSIFRGQCDNPIDGPLSRFESPWPFSEMPLQSHPSVLSMPSLYPKLISIENELREFAKSTNTVIVHGDLYEAQLLVENDTLIALLDFNEAMSARAEWDFGSYYYFHGKECLKHLLEGYTDNASAQLNYAKQALYGAILIALHHGNRGVLLKEPHRIRASVSFLSEQLA
jgi:aminoglycoside phosphotransferase (APT) family kinase protein